MKDLSSPAQVRTKQSSPRPQTPPPQADSNEQAQTEANGSDNATTDGFDVGMLQAVVGELSTSTLQRLKDVSGNNVERGRRNPPNSNKYCSKFKQR
jgi:DNA repair protein RAD5